MIFLTVHEVLNPSLLTEFNKNLEISFPRSDLSGDFNSKVNKILIFTTVSRIYLFIPMQDYAQMANDIRDFYFSKSGGQITKDTVGDYNDMMSDIWFVYGVDKAVKALSKRTTGNVFYYQFSLESKLNFVKSGFGQLPFKYDFPGASHADDLFYIFYFELVHYHTSLIQYTQFYANCK